MQRPRSPCGGTACRLNRCTTCCAPSSSERRSMRIELTLMLIRRDWPDDSSTIARTMRVRNRMRSMMARKCIIHGVTNATPADTSLTRLLVRARKIGKRLFETGCPTLEDIAREENIGASYATRLARLTFLAPDIVAAILSGNQPAELTATKLMVDTRLPLNWRDQRTVLGFAQSNLSIP